VSDKPYTCDRCRVSDVRVRHDSASGINLHEPATCQIMVAEMPPASSPAHDPLTCTCCQIALAATKERDAREAGHGEAFGTVLDRLTDAARGVVKARAEREDARRFARNLAEKVRRIQGHIEAGGANEELTAATVLCSAILAEAERGMV